MDPDGSAWISVAWIRIHEGQKMTHKNKKSEEVSCVEVLDVLF
jgi:hypothetical protein